PEALLERLVVERVADLVLHLVEGLVARADTLVDAQEMEAATGAHRLAHPARLEREGRTLEIVLHLAAAEGTQPPALVGPRAFRELLRESAEVVPIESERPHLERLGPRVRHRGVVGRVLDGEEDVAHLDALDGRVVAEVGVVVTTDLLGGDVHVLADLAVHERRLLAPALDGSSCAVIGSPSRVATMRLVISARAAPASRTGRTSAATRTPRGIARAPIMRRRASASVRAARRSCHHDPSPRAGSPAPSRPPCAPAPCSPARRRVRARARAASPCRTRGPRPRRAGA